MIRQMCPNCVRLIELPDTAAGTETACPHCGKTFRVPGAYSPSVDPAAGPGAPPPPPPLPPLEAPAASSHNRPAPPPGYLPQSPPTATGTLTTPPATSHEQSFGCSLSPKVLDWIPVACLTLVCLLTFFSWVGSYPGGTAVYTQSPWGALFGNFSSRSLPEELLQDESALTKRTHTSWLMLPYLPLLLLGVALAVIERMVSLRKWDALPKWLEPVKAMWHLRFLVLLAVAVGLLLLVLLQSWQGFGLENAIAEHAKFTVDERMKDKPGTDTSSRKNLLAVMTGQEFGRYAVGSTTAYSLVVLAHMVAVVALLGAAWLAQRGTKPPPRLAVTW